MSCVIMKLYLLAEMEDKERLTCKHKTGLEIPISLRPQGTYFFSRTLIFLEVEEQWHMYTRGSPFFPPFFLPLSLECTVIKAKFVND